jgi:outer membrane protein OmpA-like peptidoglycan-associated protein
MKYRLLIGAGVALATMFGVAGAQAQWLVGPTGPAVWYAGPEGGWSSLEDQTDTAGGRSATVHTSDGFNVGARVGAEFGWWRFEEEYRFQQTGVNSVSAGSFSVPLDGNRNAHAIMTNAIYDFGGWGWPFTPHIGVGIGAVVQHDGVSTRSGTSIGNYSGTLIHGSDTEFGYQAIAGIRYNINPSLAFDLDYRYLATTDATFKVAASSPLIPNAPVHSGYSTHNLVASLTMRFGPAPAVVAPVPPAPPPVARRVFLVFFDWDRDTITPDGMAIIQQAAAAWRSGAPVQIMVTGYTDASGSAGYNQRLSERRANNVANALARNGVPRQSMVVSGRGKNDQRVPTADGVREPQNRRVEIVFP